MGERIIRVKDFLKRNNKFIISALAGVLGLLFSPFGIVIPLDRVVINLPWSILFPLIVSMAYGWRYAIVTGLSGGALFPFLLWANNGWSNFSTMLCFVLNYSIISLVNEPFFAKRIRSSLSRVMVLLGVVVFVFWIYYSFFFNSMLSINPPFWIENTINYLDPDILYGFFYKDSINFIALVFIAYTLFRLPVIRRLFSMPVSPYMQSNHRILILSILVSLGVWFVFVGMGKFVLLGNNQLQREHISLSLLVIFTAGYLVAYILIYYSENQLKARLELNRSEQNFRKLIEFSPVPMAVANKNYQIIIVNKSFEDTYGYNLADLRLVDDLFEKVFPPINSIDFWKDLAANTLTIGEQLPVKEFLLTCKSEGVKIVEASTYVEDEYIICSFVDITVRKKTEGELIKARNKAEESDRLKTAFLQNMSHEIRTPMNAIMGFAELLPSSYTNKSKLEKYSGIINQRSRDLLDIINDILDIAKIESGQFPVNKEECNVQELFHELAEFYAEYRNRNKKQHIQFSLKAFENTDRNIMVTDKVKLKQILINLITNAFKFTQTGVIEGGCKLVDNNMVLFYVSDTGCGIPLDKQKFIFDRFTQLSNGSMGFGGTGLGLPIVKGLVNLLGGEVFLKSEEGKGSTFSFTIPAES